MKIIYFLSLLLLASCGKDGGQDGGSSQDQDSVKPQCEKFLPSDSLEDYALKGHRSRVNCHLSEEEMISSIL